MILKVRDGSWFTRTVNSSTLLGLNVSLLRDVRFRGCDIGDEEVISLAHDCPYLSGICLHDCGRVTDASIMALAKWCLQLIAIDMGKCENMADDGLVGFASSCWNVRTANLLDTVDICHLRRINLSDCTNITDIGVSAVACTSRLLNKIDISDCYQVTDVGVSAIANNCRELCYIDLYRC